MLLSGDKKKTNYSNSRTFNPNLSQFKRFSSGIEDLGKKEKVISNVDKMRKQYSNLVENGTIKESADDHFHQVMTAMIDNAASYLKVHNPGIDDIINHYNEYTNFVDMIEGLSGGGNNDV